MTEVREALDEVAIVVREFIIIGVFVFFPGEIAVDEGVDMAGEIVAEGVEAVFFKNIERVDDVADRFTHFLAIT